MRVLLIRPPLVYADLSIGFIPLGIYSSFMTRYPPMAMMYIASILRNAGHQVALMDAEAEELDIDSVAKRMQPFEPDLILGTVNIYNSIRNFDDLISLKQKLNAPLVVRGHFPRHYPEETMARLEVDAAMTGKGFTNATAVVDAFQTGGGLADVPGIRFRKNGEIVDTGKENPIGDPDLLPYPARDLTDPELYVTNLTHRRPFTTMFASFGCPYHCNYCQDRKVPYSVRSTDNVIGELSLVVEKQGYREVTFLDPNFTVKKDWVMDLCRKIIDRRLDLTFTMRTRPDLLDPEMLDLLAQAGCVRISLGIESGDPEILETLERKADLEKIKQAAGWIRDRGIMSFGYFMIGNKGESETSLQRTLEYVRTLPLHFAQFLQTIPLPDTEVLEGCKEKFGVDIWREIYFGRYPKPNQFRSQNNSLTLRQLKTWSRKFYVGFYLDTKRWPKILRLKFLPSYFKRQWDIITLMMKLTLLRRIRKNHPAFALAKYPYAKNGGPGNQASTIDSHAGSK